MSPLDQMPPHRGLAGVRDVPSREVSLRRRWRSWRWRARLEAQLLRARHFGPAPSAETLTKGRREFDDVGAYMGEPVGAEITDDDADGVPVQWLDFREPGTDGPVIFYVHGGAYAMGSIVASRHAAATHARRARALCLVVEYALAPEHPFPTGLEEVERAWDWLAARHDPAQTIVIGESAGGGLAIALLARLRDRGVVLPTAAVTISAWANLAMDTASYRDRRRRDLALDIRMLHLAADAYAGHTSRATPALSPVHADLAGLPKLLLVVGTEEVVWDDTITIHTKAREAGVDSELLVGRGQIHCFTGYADQHHVAAEAADEIADWVRTAVRLPPLDPAESPASR